MNDQWYPDLWETIYISTPDMDDEYLPSNGKSFYDFQEPSDKYEVRGILPKMTNSGPVGIEL